MQMIFEGILPIFLLVLTGVALKRAHFISADFWPGLEQFGYYILYPLYLFLTLARAHFENIAIGPVGIVYSALLAVLAVTLLLAWPLLRKAGVSAPSFTTVFQTSTRWNGFIALAIAEGMAGAEGTAFIAFLMGVIVIPINLANISVLVWFGGGSRQFSHLVLKVFKNPIIIGTAAGLAVHFSGLTLYPPLETAVDLLSRSALGLGLITVGAGLVIKDALRPSPLTLLPVFLKLVLFPMMIIGGSIMAGFDLATIHLLTIAAGMPTALNGYLLARQMNGDAPLYAAIATLQTAGSFLTIPLMLVVADQLAG